VEIYPASQPEWHTSGLPADRCAETGRLRFPPRQTRASAPRLRTTAPQARMSYRMQYRGAETTISMMMTWPRVRRWAGKSSRGRAWNAQLAFSKHLV